MFITVLEICGAICVVTITTVIVFGCINGISKTLKSDKENKKNG